MIGEKIKANANFPIDSPRKVAYAVIGTFLLGFFLLSIYLASSLSL